MRKFLFILLPLFFFTVAYYNSLDSRGLLEPDETRYAEITREMVKSDNWIIPRLVGVRYFEKPPMGYWLMALSEKCFGETSFAIRFPSAIAVGLTALLVFIITWQGCLRSTYNSWSHKKQKKRSAWTWQEFWRFFIKRCNATANETNGVVSSFPPLTTASLAALVYLSCSGVFAIGTTAVLDSVFTFFLSAAIVSFFFALEMQKQSRTCAVLRFLFLVVSGLFCGCAFLTKGLLAVVLPALLFVVWLIWQRRFIAIFSMSWIPLLVASLMVFPWVLQIHWWDNDFWRYFFYEEHIRRFVAPSSQQHEEPFWYFLLHSPLLFLPWVVVIPAALQGVFYRNDVTAEWQGQKLCEKGMIGKKNVEETSHYSHIRGVDILLKFSFLWFLVPFIFFSASGGKLLTYILPCAVPFAIMMAIGLTYFFAQEEQGLFQAGVVLLSTVVLIFLALFIYVQIFGIEGLNSLTRIPGGTPLYQDSWPAGLIAISLGVVLFWCGFARYSKGITKAFVLALAPLLFFSLSGYAIPDMVVRKKIPARFFEEYKSSVSEDDLILVDESSLRVVSWYWQRTDLFAIGWAGELTYGMVRDDARINGMDRIVSFENLRKILEKNPRRVIVVGRTKHINEWRREKLLPEPMFSVGNGAEGYVIMRF